MTYLWRHPKSGVYYFRRAVPDDVRRVIGKTMVKKSLGTRDVAAAKRKVPPLALQTEQEFLAAKARRDTPPRTELSDGKISVLADDYLRVRLAEDDAHRIEGSKEDDDLYKAINRQVMEAVGRPGRWSDDEATAEIGLSDRAYQKQRETIEFVLPALKQKLARGDTRIVAFDVDEFLAIHDIKLDPASASYRKLCHEFLKVSIKANEASLKRLDGEIVETPPARAISFNSRPHASASGGLHLMEMFNRWLDERKPPKKTELDFTTAIRRFIELHGDLSVPEINKAHVRTYKDALLRLPRSCSGEMRKMTLPQVLERLTARPAAPGTTLTPGSINKAVGALQTVLHWVERQGFLDEHPNWSNPAANMKMHNPAEQEDNRLPYDAGDLKVIFESGVFRNGERPRGGGGEAAKWLPLIALFSGAREEEIGQALVADVKEEHGIQYLDINTLDRRAGKRVKNKSSRRKLPLHPELIRVGFLEYVEDRRRSGDQRLFPDLRPAVSGQVTGNWSKWWGRYTDGLGISDPRKVFHSFRHAFKDACRAARIEEELHDALTGHTSASVGRRYGGGVPLEVLAEAVAKVSYKGESAGEKIPH
jgi:integrase